jgi:riboflavin biosynthesis pyrimidine reductase
MPKFAFKERFSIVLTSNPDKYDVKDYPAEIIFLKSDLNAIFLELEKRKIQKVAVIGGGMINQFFLKEKLINEIFVTIAPKLFLTGIPSFNQLKWSLDQPENLSQIDLELLHFDKLGKNEIHLQYKVLYT